MNIVQFFLLRALGVSESELRRTLSCKISQGGFHGLAPKVEALLLADQSIRDDLWKFSVSLDVPHQLLFDAYNLERAIRRAF